MNARVLRIQQIDMNKINYLKVKDLSTNQKKQIYIDYEKKPLVFQCPSLLNENMPIKITEDYYELEIPLITQEKNKQSSLINFFKKLDSKIVNEANNNVKIWFNENKMSYTCKTIVKDSEKYPDGVIKLKIIKTLKFESLLFLDNNKRINIKEIPKDSWVKILLEVHSIIINHENKTFYVFLRPHAFSFKEKEVKLAYKFLEDSDSDEEIPDSDTNNLFLRQTENQKSNQISDAQTSSQINYNLSNLKKLELTTNSNFSSSTSSEEMTKKSSNSSESLNKLSESEESSESLNKLSDSDQSSSESLEKLSDSDNKKDFNKNFIFNDKKKISLTSTSSNSENDNDIDNDSTNLASILKRN
jgi:hypothetical protein